jgi:hypothetical protein
MEDPDAEFVRCAWLEAEMTSLQRHPPNVHGVPGGILSA